MTQSSDPTPVQFSEGVPGTKGTERTVDAKAERFRQYLQRNRAEISACLPAQVDADQFIAHCHQAMRGTPQLFNCDPRSVFAAAMQASMLGLSPDPQLGQVYFVPFRGRCQLIAGYRGMITLALNSGMVSSIEARVVRPDDKFDFQYGTDAWVRHKPDLYTTDRSIIAAYAVVHYKDGRYSFVVCGKQDIEEARNASASAHSSSSPWVKSYAAMAAKTAVRQLFKYQPVSTAAQRIVTLDEQAEHGIEQSLPDAFDGVATVDDARPKNSLSRATDKMRARLQPSVGAEEEPSTEPEQSVEPSPDGDDEVSFVPYVTPAQHRMIRGALREAALTAFKDKDMRRSKNKQALDTLIEAMWYGIKAVYNVSSIKDIVPGTMLDSVLGDIKEWRKEDVEVITPAMAAELLRLMVGIQTAETPDAGDGIHAMATNRLNELVKRVCVNTTSTQFEKMPTVDYSAVRAQLLKRYETLTGASAQKEEAE